jgi:hypothetical protein
MLRTLRAVRLLRFVNFSGEFRIIVSTMSQVVKGMGWFWLVCGCFFLVYAQLGVVLFKGFLRPGNVNIHGTAFYAQTFEYVEDRTSI